MKTVQQTKGTASGIVEAPFTEVSALLMDVHCGRFSGHELPLVIDGVAAGVEIQGGPQKFTVFAGESSAATRLCFVEVDKQNHSVSIYGGWWFRGEYTIEAHPKGSLLTYRLSNAATGVSGAIAGLVHRRELKGARAVLEHMLRKVGERLRCAVSVAEQ